MHPGVEIPATSLAMEFMTVNAQSDRMSLLGDAFDLSPETGFDSLFKASTYWT
jgi:hypothetical protein